MALPPEHHLPPFVTTDISSISLALLVLGAYVCLVGQVSYFLKERLFMSSALISICLGIAVGPIGLNWISPWIWTGYDDELRNEVTFQFCRIIIGVQVMFAGISLPAAYLRTEWRSIVVLLLPIMTIAWFVSAGLILAFVPDLTFVEALCISACVTPTDPILANAIVKGRYAEKHVPHTVRNIISAESGANDGLGYPFIFLPIFLMKRGDDSIAAVMREWVVTTWLYQIGLACVMGALIGYVARKSLKIAHKRKLVDHESFLAYGIGLAVFTLGVVGVIGSDDVLAAFVAGNSLTWKDFYRIESEDDTFQDVIDSLLNAAIFIYIGTLLPWSEFGEAPLSGWRLVLLGLCILAVRRLPWVMMLYPITPALASPSEALFAGWFGPIGVSAVYYALLAEKELPEERVLLRKVIVPIVLFIALSSTVAHGVTIPLTKFAPKAFTHTRTFTSFASNNAGHLVQRLRATAVKPSDISSPLRARLARQPTSKPATPVLSRVSSLNFRQSSRSATLSQDGSATSVELQASDESITRLEEGPSSPKVAHQLSGAEAGRPPVSESILRPATATAPDDSDITLSKVQFEATPSALR